MLAGYNGYTYTKDGWRVVIEVWRRNQVGTAYKACGKSVRICLGAHVGACDNCPSPINTSTLQNIFRIKYVSEFPAF